MKNIISGALLFAMLGMPAVSAPAVAKKPFYRNRDSAGVRPRAAGDPVVVNSASFEPGISPGGLATVFGNDLTSVRGVVVASRLPLPTVLADVSVLVNGMPAPIYSVAFANGQDQISFQVPYAAATGPDAIEVEVFDGAVQTADVITDSFIEDPGIFVHDGNYALAVHPADGALVGPADPAVPGEVVVLYVTGLGPLSIPLDDGFGAPSSPLAYTIDPFQVLVDNESSDVLFSGMAPGFVGVYQINFRVPWDAGFGNRNLKIQSPYASSRVAVIPVQR